jgi:hypothetical protein
MTSLLVYLAAATLATPLARLEASGVEVALNLDGYRQDIGPGQLGKTYFRLGQYHLADQSRAGGKPFFLSVLVDEVPAKVDLKRLREHVLEKLDPKPEVIAVPAPPGFRYSYRQTVTSSIYQWHLYFHTLHERKWVELHFSSVSESPEFDESSLEKLALEVIRSVQVSRKHP